MNKYLPMFIRCKHSFWVIIALLAINFSPSISLAQFASPSPIYTSYIDRPTDVVSADIDQDRDQDIITSSEFSGLAWFENLGNGEFDVHLIDTNINASSLTAEDINQDGKIDLTVAIAGDGGEIAWYKNTGKSFGNRRIVTTNVAFPEYRIHTNNPKPVDITFALVNNDTLPDMITSSSEGDREHRIAWYENEGGYFAEQRNIAYGESAYKEYIMEHPSNIELVDFENDEDQDLITRTDKGLDYILKYCNQGDGTFSQPDTLSSGFDYIGLIKTIDLNNNGRWDIIATGRNGFYTLVQQQDGSFDRNYIKISNTRITDATVVDIDGDQWEDLVFTAEGTNNVFWVKNVEDSLSDIRVMSESVRDASSLSVADLDSDSDTKLDVLASSYQRDELSWFRQSKGTFGSKLVINSGVTAENGLLLLNITDKKVQDLIATSRNQVNILRHSAGGFYRPQQIYEKAGQNTSAANFDGDENQDLLIHDGGKLLWLQNQENGKFLSANIIYNDPDGFSVYEVTVGDMNNDGVDDLVIIYFTGDYTLEWKANNGSGAFGDSTHISNINLRDISVADLDSDDDLDILGLQDNRVVWFENMGDGQFSNAIVIDSQVFGESGKEITGSIADLNNDGNLDILVAGRNWNDESKIGWYRNTGGSFSNQQVISTNYDHPKQVIAADINQDSLPEVMSLSKSEGSLVSFPNQDGSFGNANILYNFPAEVEENLNFQAGDIDGDEDTDIVMYEPTTINKFIKLENQTITDIPDARESEIARTVRLQKNYPNPFNPSTTIRFSLPQNSNVQLSVYNTIGQEVATLVDRQMNPGAHSVMFNADNLPSGVYIYRLKTDNYVKSRKMLLLK